MKWKLEKLAIKWRLFNEDDIEREIYNGCIILKNLAIVHKELPMSADFILEELMDNSRILKNVYADIISAYRSGRSEGAFSILYERIPSGKAKNFAMILAKVDQINPAELVPHMSAFEETFAAERMTRGMRRAERKSIITTMVATASIFAILLNFVIVVVFMDTLAMLGHVF